MYISHIERRGRWLYAICYVKSQRSRELCYQVVVKWRLDMRYLYGRCECLDFKFRGGPCKHIVKAKVAVREYLKKAKEYR
ncbi:MAG: SWIM zinc finger family protein [Pyrobaculum sp.]